jgi:hypothetical protein
MDGIRKKVHKYSEFFLTKIILLFRQKKFESAEHVEIRYLSERCMESEYLIIVFSACTRKGLRARYNYVRTLSSIKANKLFILDDFAEDHRGSYYIGHNGKFDEEKAVGELIREVASRYHADRMVFCGSSKGGWAALNFGLTFPNTPIIIGGPQYHLGTYLIKSGNLECYKHIIGTVSDEHTEILNQHLSDKINAMNNGGNSIYIHYSNQEHTYPEHIADLLQDLKKSGYKVIEDIESYQNHSDISYFFPDFLISTIKALIAVQSY